VVTGQGGADLGHQLLAVGNGATSPGVVRQHLGKKDGFTGPGGEDSHYIAGPLVPRAIDTGLYISLIRPQGERRGLPDRDYGGF